jgi:hypothetical protein
MKTSRKGTPHSFGRIGQSLHKGAASVGGLRVEIQYRPHRTHVINYRYFAHELTPVILPGALPLPKYCADSFAAGLSPFALASHIENGKGNAYLARLYGVTVAIVAMLRKRWGIDTPRKTRAEIINAEGIDDTTKN